MHRSRLVGPLVIVLGIAFIGCGESGRKGADNANYQDHPNHVVLKVTGMT